MHDIRVTLWTDRGIGTVQGSRVYARSYMFLPVFLVVSIIFCFQYTSWVFNEGLDLVVSLLLDAQRPTVCVSRCFIFARVLHWFLLLSSVDIGSAYDTILTKKSCLFCISTTTAVSGVVPSPSRYIPSLPSGRRVPHSRCSSVLTELFHDLLSHVCSHGIRIAKDVCRYCRVPRCPAWGVHCGIYVIAYRLLLTQR